MSRYLLDERAPSSTLAPTLIEADSHLLPPITSHLSAVNHFWQLPNNCYHQSLPSITTSHQLSTLAPHYNHSCYHQRLQSIISPPTARLSTSNHATAAIDTCPHQSRHTCQLSIIFDSCPTAVIIKASHQSTLIHTIPQLLSSKPTINHDLSSIINPSPTL